ncbi:unnamed protein product [Pseudo-nitzschia multistriata]|uniref:Uncharacterized protein n=1 Tax=Pseudo-nitzschia multistriata TaxID=183589 RepID=A0A448ZS16_9STRA|nr:unnamed protein product [Pseudo-nitzschia multistriata]
MTVSESDTVVSPSTMQGDWTTIRNLPQYAPKKAAPLHSEAVCSSKMENEDCHVNKATPLRGELGPRSPFPSLPLLPNFDNDSKSVTQPLTPKLKLKRSQRSSRSKNYVLPHTFHPKPSYRKNDSFITPLTLANKFALSPSVEGRDSTQQENLKCESSSSNRMVMGKSLLKGSDAMIWPKANRAQRLNSVGIHLPSKAGRASQNKKHKRKYFPSEKKQPSTSSSPRELPFLSL